ncbi:MAG: helix-turn-helix domain-containing protein [Thermoplasmatales archaeon]
MTDKATIMKEILALRNKGFGYEAIANRLREQGIADLSPSTVRRYLKEAQIEPSSISAISQDRQATLDEEDDEDSVKSNDSPINSQDAPVKNIKTIEGEGIESPGKKNTDTLSNPEKFKERQGIVQSWTDDYKRDINWEDILLAILSLVFLAVMVIIGVVLTLKK